VIQQEFNPRTPDQFFSDEHYEQYMRDEAEKYRKLGAAQKWGVWLAGLPTIVLNLFAGIGLLITDISGGDYWDKFIIAALFGLLYGDMWQSSKHNYYLMKRYALTMLAYREGL
jgi:hypothetical protein